MAGQHDAQVTIPRDAFVRCLLASCFWAIGLQYFFLVLIQSFYTTWLPTYLVNERKLSLTSMGIYASLPRVAMFASVFLTGSATRYCGEPARSGPQACRSSLPASCQRAHPDHRRARQRWPR